MRLIVGILQNKESVKPYNYQLEIDAYSVYRKLPEQDLKDMISWRDGNIKKYRDEIKSVQEPILNALKRALKEKHEG